MVGNDKIKSLPDVVAANPPGAMASAFSESDAAKVAPKSNATARADGKLVFVEYIRRITGT